MRTHYVRQCIFLNHQFVNKHIQPIIIQFLIALKHIKIHKQMWSFCLYELPTADMWLCWGLPVKHHLTCRQSQGCVICYFFHPLGNPFIFIENIELFKIISALLHSNNHKHNTTLKLMFYLASDVSLNGSKCKNRLCGHPTSHYASER